MLIAGLLILILSVSLYAQEQIPLKYCIQVATRETLEDAAKLFKRIEGMPQARIEKRGRYFVLRVGASEEIDPLKDLLKKIRVYFPDAYIKKCAIDPRVVVSLPKPEEKKEQKPQQPPKPQAEKKTQPAVDPKALEALKIALQSLRQEYKLQQEKLEVLEKKLEEILKDIGELKVQVAEVNLLPQGDNKESSSLGEKLLLVGGGAILGLFLLTWIFMFVLYRRIGTMNLKNTSFINELFKFIKVMNLLSKGLVVKMEKGKILVYDETTKRWKEVE